MVNTVNLKISELEVSKINPRFIQVVADEQTAISELIRLEPKKMLNLLNKIVKGVLPIPFYLVKNKDELILMDGNRRLTAMKILTNPKLIPVNDKNKDIINFCNDAKFQIPDSMPCIIYDELTEELFDVLESLHVTDESKSDWTPLAQYRMSSRLGGNKHAWMKTLLFYYDNDDVDKMTTNNSDKYNRMFNAFNANGIKIKSDGQIDTQNPKQKLDIFYKLFKTKRLDTRSPKEEYQEFVDNIFNKGESPQIESSKFLFILEKNRIFEGQNINIKNLIKIKNLSTNRFIVYDPKELTITFKDPNGKQCESFNNNLKGIWHINCVYEDVNDTINIEVIEKLMPMLKFVSDMTVVYQGNTCYLRNQILNAKNSYGEDVKDKVKIKPMPNQQLKINNEVFEDINPIGFYKIQYYFNDINEQKVSQVLILKVTDEIDYDPFLSFSENGKGILGYGKNITISIEPTINKLVSEINQLVFKDYPCIITCAARSIIEISYDTLYKLNLIDYKKNFEDKLEEIVKKLKLALDKKDYIINIGSINFYSHQKETNFLNQLNLIQINALLNQGAHTSTQVINTSEIENCLNKDISHLLALINEWVNKEIK